MNVELPLVALVAQIIASLAVGTSVVVGVIQLRNFERQRREQAAVTLVHSFQSADFNQALRLLWSIPDGLTAAELRARPDVDQAAVQIGTTVETIGVLVHRRMVPLDIVDDLMGDAIVAFWPKLQDWILSLRREQSRESVFEWFQWLVERLRERERRRGTGAFMKYSGWKS